MFRRRWSGLPDDPEFPADLEKLGYFVNKDDEIRSIKEPNFYFDYFINKSIRYNDRQRFAFTLAVQDLIHARLASPPLSLTKLLLPLGTPPTSPHTPIFVSSDLHLKKRVIVLFGERDQDLGVLAHRVVGGAGGLDAGSAVGLVKAFLLQGVDDVGFVLANTGESCWWPEGQRALSYRQSGGVRMKSAVHKGRYFDPSLNGIPGHGNVDEHVRTLFESVLGNKEFVQKEARIEIIGVSEGAVGVEKHLDENWTEWKDRIVSLAILGGGIEQDQVKDEGFRTFLKERARAYITCTTPLDTPMANPGGNPYAHYNTTFGCPVLSSGEDYHTELTLIKALPAVIAWMGEVYAADRDDRAYKNPLLEVTFRSEEFEESLEFRDRPVFEGYPKPVGPPPNVSSFADDTEPKKLADVEKEEIRVKTTEPEAVCLVSSGSSCHPLVTRKTEKNLSRLSTDALVSTEEAEQKMDTIKITEARELAETLSEELTNTIDTAGQAPSAAGECLDVADGPMTRETAQIVEPSLAENFVMLDGVESNHAVEDMQGGLCDRQAAINAKQNMRYTIRARLNATRAKLYTTRAELRQSLAALCEERATLYDEQATIYEKQQAVHKDTYEVKNTCAEGEDMVSVHQPLSSVPKEESGAETKWAGAQMKELDTQTKELDAQIQEVEAQCKEVYGLCKETDVQCNELDVQCNEPDAQYEDFLGEETNQRLDAEVQPMKSEEVERAKEAANKQTEAPLHGTKASTQVQKELTPPARTKDAEAATDDSNITVPDPQTERLTESCLNVRRKLEIRVAQLDLKKREAERLQSQLKSTKQDLQATRLRLEEERSARTARRKEVEISGPGLLQMGVDDAVPASGQLDNDQAKNRKRIAEGQDAKPDEDKYSSSGDGEVAKSSWGTAVREAYASLMGKAADGGRKTDAATTEGSQEMEAADTSEETEKEAFV